MPSESVYISAGPVVGATKLRNICNPVSSVSCILWTLFPISRLPISAAGSLESVSGILELLLLRTGDRHIYPQPGGAQGLGWHQNHIEKSSNFKPVSKPTKIMKIGLKANQNHEKSTLEPSEIQFLQKLIFAIPPLPCFCNPGHPNLDPKIMRKSKLEIDMKTCCFLLQKYPNNSQTGAPKSTKNR